MGFSQGSAGGGAVPDLCRKHGFSDASFYNCRAKFGGMEVSDAKRLKGLENENARLKKLLAELMLDNEALKVIVRYWAALRDASAAMEEAIDSGFEINDVCAQRWGYASPMQFELVWLAAHKGEPRNGLS